MYADKEVMTTLAEIRSALKEIEEQRRDKSLSHEEQEALELSAVALRDAERAVTAYIEREIIKNMESVTEEIGKLSRKIRDRVTDMNRTVKVLDKIEILLKNILKTLKAIGRW